jgi:ribonuclease D
MVTEPDQLAALCAALTTAGSFAFDTEFVGEDSFTPVVCLLQVATADHVAIVDPLDKNLDVTPLWSLIADPKIEKIVHAGSEDLGLCFKETGRAAANVLDLQVAAGFVGMGYPTSLSRLVKLVMGVQIPKSQTLTDWRRRPLTAEQLDYAAQDVAHLPAMAISVCKALSTRGRLEWAMEECEATCRATACVPSRAQKLRKLPGMASMTKREMAIALAILEEREKLALQFNRPARVLLKDYLIVEMARRGWTDVAKLQSLRGMTLNAAGLQKIAKSIELGRTASLDDIPMPEDEAPDSEEDMLLSLLSMVLHDHCSRMELAYSLLATRRSLRAYIKSRRGGPPSPADQASLLTGWRAAAIGDLLDRLLTGRSAIRILRESDRFRLSIDS